MIKLTDIVPWICVVVLALGGASSTACKNPSVDAERAQNASIGVQHQIDLDKCFTAAAATIQTTGDRDKADREYAVCANAADLDAGAHP